MKDSGCFSSIIDGDNQSGSWNKSIANKLVLDARGNDTRKWGLTWPEILRGLEKSWFKNCKENFNPSDLCNNPDNYTWKFCTLSLDWSDGGGHTMNINSVNKGLFGSCSFNTDDTSIQGSGWVMPVEPGFQTWGPNGIKKPKDKFWDGYKPSYIICCDSPCS
jgi:hypothetical protein